MTKGTVTEESNEAFFKANVETGKYKQFMVECVDMISLLFHILSRQSISKIWTMITSVVNFVFSQAVIGMGSCQSDASK